MNTGTCRSPMQIKQKFARFWRNILDLVQYHEEFKTLSIRLKFYSVPVYCTCCNLLSVVNLFWLLDLQVGFHRNQWSCKIVERIQNRKDRIKKFLHLQKTLSLYLYTWLTDQVYTVETLTFILKKFLNILCRI